jgi:predicted DNA-binding transcriptional regulator YafY
MSEQIVELQQRRKQGTLVKTLMKEYGLSKASVYRYLRENNVSTPNEA